jgi:glycine cleavage system H protein
MDGFSYHNIFDTKGIEYLIIIAFLILLVPFMIILNRRVKIQQSLRHVMGILTTGVLRIPQGVYYNGSHIWAHLAKSGIASIGLDDLLLHITGATHMNYLKKPGETIMKGEAMAELHHDGKVLKLYAPITGTVAGTNEALTENPQILQEDPYDAGWLYKIRPARWKAETGQYYLAESATEWSKKELERFKDFLAINLPRYSPEASMITLQDGGELRDHVMREMPGELWKDFQREFLDQKEI